MNKKEIKNLPNYIRTILFYVNNVHWSNNLTINRSVLTTKVTKKYLNQISINLEDHKEAMILFKRHYNSNNEQNRPYVIEYLAHIKNIRDNNQHSIHNFYNNFKKDYNINIFESNNNYIDILKRNKNNFKDLDALEIYFINKNNRLKKNYSTIINKIFQNNQTHPELFGIHQEEKKTHTDNISVDEQVILDNLEIALMAILYINNTNIINKKHLLELSNLTKKMMMTKLFNTSMTNTINLDCFKAIMLDYGPTHPILNKNHFWNTDIDWDKLYLYDIFDEIESTFVNLNDTNNHYEWNEIPWKDNKTVISLYNLINKILNIIYCINYVSNHLLTQPNNIIKNCSILISKKQNKKKYLKYLQVFKNRKINSIYLQNYRKNLNISFLFNIRSIYPTNHFYNELLKTNNNVIGYLKELQTVFLKRVQEKISHSEFIDVLKTFEHEYTGLKDVTYCVNYIQQFINDFIGSSTMNAKDDRILFLLHYINKYLEQLEIQRNVNESIMDIWKSTKNQLIHNYLNVVISAARDEFYSNKHVQLIELIQEGYIALMASVDQFEPDLGYSFNTYCTFWIHQAIQKNSSLLSPTTNSDFTKNNSTKLMSTDVPMFTNPHNIVGDYIEESSTTHVEINQNQLIALKNSINWLPPSIVTLLFIRYGVFPFKKHTLEEVGNLFSVNGETIRYIIRIALKKFQEINKSTDTHINEWIKQIKDHTF